MNATKTTPPLPRETGVYRIGTAARMAGIPVNTLRIWERRHSVVGPTTSSGRQRLYSSSNIQRLTLIKQLVDLGYAIGTVAPLGDEALRAMRDAARPLQIAAPTRRLRVALVGPMLTARPIVESLGGTSLTVVATAPDAERAASLAGCEADVVVVERSTLDAPDVERLGALKEACGASLAVALYRYAAGAVIRRLRLAGHRVARATTDPVEIEALCLGASSPTPAPALATPAAPRFDAETLSQMASLSRTVECECPKHLVDLVMSLSSFERYSGECASRTPADAVLHKELGLAAARARVIVEEALERVARAEGFPLQPLAA